MIGRISALAFMPPDEVRKYIFQSAIYDKLVWIVHTTEHLGYNAVRHSPTRTAHLYLCFPNHRFIFPYNIYKYYDKSDNVYHRYSFK